MEALDKKIIEEVNNGVIPGMTYSVIKDGNTYTGSAGYKGLVPQKENIAEDTLYDLASLTKVLVTVTLVSKLYAQGRIGLGDKLSKYLDRFKYDDITIFDLLTHTSGLPADLPVLSITTRDDILNQVYATDKGYVTGKKVVYSDLGYILLGEMISKIYGKPLEEVAKEEIFDPLEMTSTCFNPIDKESCAPTEVTEGRGVIKGVVHDEKAFSLGGAAGNAGVFSNAKDLSNFLRMVLNDGVYNGKEFLPKEIIDLWFLPVVYENDASRMRSLCWIVGNNDLVVKGQQNVISFNGFTGPSLMIDRENKLGIALLTNRVHPTRDNRQISRERPIITDEVYMELGIKPRNESITM